ncbi:MAG TPA: hypothetical protein V6C81_20085 [Planktothrix sp.]
MTEHNANNLYERATTGNAGAVIHVRVNGRSRDIALDTLGLSASSADDAVRNAVANFMELAPANLSAVIERHENGNMTLRPEAVFG